LKSLIENPISSVNLRNQALQWISVLKGPRPHVVDESLAKVWTNLAKDSALARSYFNNAQADRLRRRQCPYVIGGLIRTG
jgi:hypothetical protein